MNAETWKEIEGWPDYEVSDMGRVRSWKSQKNRWTTRSSEPRFLFVNTNKKGYQNVKLCKGDVAKNMSVNRLVAKAFLGESPVGAVVDHINRNRADNRSVNLRYITNRENVLCGVAPTAINSRKTHCPQGHEYVPENLVVSSLKRGNRKCLTCFRDKNRKWSESNPRPKSSQYKHVYWNKSKKKWVSFYRRNKKMKVVGYFNDEEQAYKAALTALENLNV